MKTFVTFLGLIAVASASQEPEACAVCRQGSGAVLAELNSELNLDYQQQIIINEGCPFWPDPEGCATGVMTWWKRLASVVYTDKAAAMVCNALEPACELPSMAS